MGNLLCTSVFLIASIFQFLFLLFYFFTCKGVLIVCISVQHVHTQRPEIFIVPLQLELQILVSSYVSAQNWTQVDSPEEQPKALNSVPPFSPQCFIFFKLRVFEFMFIGDIGLYILFFFVLCLYLVLILECMWCHRRSLGMFLLCLIYSFLE